MKKNDFFEEEEKLRRSGGTKSPIDTYFPMIGTPKKVTKKTNNYKNSYNFGKKEKVLDSVIKILPVGTSPKNAIELAMQLLYVARLRKSDVDQTTLYDQNGNIAGKKEIIETSKKWDKLSRKDKPLEKQEALNLHMIFSIGGKEGRRKMP